jgi:sulfate adenylyltransferase subunit 2
MSQIEQLIGRAEALSHASGLSLSTISRKLLNDGKGLARLKSGGQCTLKTLETAFERLSALEAETTRPASRQPTNLETKSIQEQPMKADATPGRDPMMMTHLDRIEAEAIHIMREVAAEAENPVMLYSVGKDSSVMLHLALKAFYPSVPPFPIMHVDTTWKFREMIEFRDATAKRHGLNLIVHINEEGVRQGVGPFTHGSQIHTDTMKTQSLKQALDKYKFDAAFGGARRDEEKSRAKERIFSFRSAQHRWDPKNQRPELWSTYNTRISKGESIRVFPLSNWTELDIWQYIYRENISIPDLYFAAKRPVVERDGTLIMVDDDRIPLGKGEEPKMEMVRFRTLGCYPLTGAVRSTATTLPEIIQETLLTTSSERQGRVIDHDQAASMEKKKQEGYF